MITYYIINLFFFSKLILLPGAFLNPLCLILLTTLIVILVILKNRITTIINAIGYFLVWFPYKRNQIIYKIICQIIKTYKQLKTFVNTPWKNPSVQFSILLYGSKNDSTELYLTTNADCTAIAKYVDSDNNVSLEKIVADAHIVTTEEFSKKITPLWSLDFASINTMKYLNKNIDVFMYHPKVIADWDMTENQSKQMILMQKVQGNLNALSTTQKQKFTEVFPDLDINQIASITSFWANAQQQAKNKNDKFHLRFLEIITPQIDEYIYTLDLDVDDQTTALKDLYVNSNIIFQDYLEDIMGFNHNQLTINPNIWEGVNELAKMRWWLPSWWPSKPHFYRDLVRGQLPLPPVNARSSEPIGYQEMVHKRTTLFAEVEQKYGPFMEPVYEDMDLPFECSEIDMIMCGFPKFGIITLFFKTIF